MFSFLRSHQGIFHSGLTILYSNQQCRKISTFPHFGQDLFSVFMPVALLVGMKKVSCFDLHFPHFSFLFLFIYIFVSSLEKCQVFLPSCELDCFVVFEL